MSAYAAAYAAPSGGYGAAGYGSSGAYGGSASGACGGGYSGSSTAGAPTSYAPPGAGGKGASKPPAAADNFSYAGGLGGVGSWPTVEQLVAAVPVRPYEFALPPQKASVGDRGNLDEHRGIVPKPYAVGEDAEFFLLKCVLTDNEVAEIVATGSKVLGELIGMGKGREVDPSDGRPRFATDLVSKGAYGANLADVLRPVVEGAMLPYIRRKYDCPGAALATARFRRFVPEERRFVGPHHEHGAFAVASFGLQDPQAFTGGMFVQGSGRAFLDRKFLPLGRGDACVHRFDLQHGVEVQDGSRLELVLFFKDSASAAAGESSPWYAKAAEEAGDSAAQYGLALAAAAAKDYSGAKAWLDKACAQDHPEALYTQAEWVWEPPAGSGFQADTAKALQLLRRAAELGHGKSQSRLGGMLASGVKGRVQQDSWEGKRLLRLAFEQDDPEAGFHLGQSLLQEGDRDGATKLLAACAKGHPRACFQVAEMYREGQYQFPKDIPQSLRYTKWAAHQGDSQALSNLGHLIINGMGVVRDDAKAVRLFRHAAKLGAAEGMLNYGLALLRGNGGVKVDYQEALEWAQKAAAAGHTLAHQQLPMFFNAAKNPNPPARSVPRSKEELQRLGVKELRDLLRSEGIDFSDCVEKTDLVARAAMHLPGVAEPWDAAPEHTLLLEPPKRTRAELLKQQKQQQTVSPVPGGPTAPTSAAATSSTAGPSGGASAAPAAPTAAPAAAAAAPSAAYISGAAPSPARTAAPAQAAAAPAAAAKSKNEDFEFVD